MPYSFTLRNRTFSGCDDKTENALVPNIMLQLQNADTSWHQDDNKAISMLRMPFLKNSPVNSIILERQNFFGASIVGCFYMKHFVKAER